VSKSLYVSVARGGVCLFMTDRKIDQFFTAATPNSAKRPRESTPPDSVDRLGAAMVGGKVGDLTLEQLTASMGTLLDAKLANLATKDDLASLTKKVSDLTDENKQLREEVDRLRAQEKLVLGKLVDLESRSRRNNLIFKGLQWRGTAPDFREVVQRFCAERLGAGDNLWVNRAHPLGRNGKTLIAHIPDDRDIEYVLTQAKIRLKGTPYVVHRDFPLEIRQKRACLAAVRAEVERLSGPKKMPLVFDHLLVDKCRLAWEDGELRAGREDGVQRLRETTGHDGTVE